MFRALFSLIAVAMIAVTSVLLYNHFFAPQHIADRSQDLTGTSNPPVKPVSPEPPAIAPPVAPQPVAPPAPVVQTQPEPVRAQVAELPRGKRTHVVQSGESLSSISKLYFGTPEHCGKLARANNLRNKDIIRAGQVLYLPDLPLVSAGKRPEERPLERTAEPPEESAAAEHSDDSTATADRKKEDFDPMPPTLSIAVPISPREKPAQ